MPETIVPAGSKYIGTAAGEAAIGGIPALAGGKTTYWRTPEGEIRAISTRIEKRPEGRMRVTYLQTAPPVPPVTAPIEPAAEVPTITPAARMTAAEQMKAMGFGVTPTEYTAELQAKARAAAEIPEWAKPQKVSAIPTTPLQLTSLTTPVGQPYTAFMTLPSTAIYGAAITPSLDYKIGRVTLPVTKFVEKKAEPDIVGGIQETLSGVTTGIYKTLAGEEQFGEIGTIAGVPYERVPSGLGDLPSYLRQVLGGAITAVVTLPITAVQFGLGMVTRPVETITEIPKGIGESLKTAGGSGMLLGMLAAPAIYGKGIRYLREPVTYPKVREVAIFRKPTIVAIHPEFEELFAIKGKIGLVREVTPAVTRGQLFLQKAFPAFVKPKVEYYIGQAKFTGVGIAVKEPFPQAIIIGKAKIPMPKGLKEIPFMAKREIAWEAPLAVRKLRGIEYGFLEAERIGKVVAAGRGKALQLGRIETPFAIKEIEAFKEFAGVKKIAAKPVYFQRRIGEFEIIRPKVEFAKLYEVKPAKAIIPPKPPEVIARPVLPEKPIFYWEQPTMFKAPPVKEAIFAPQILAERAPKPVVAFAPQVAEAVVKITTVKRAVGVMPEIKLALGEVAKPISKMFPLKIKELPTPKPIFAPLFVPQILKERVVTTERLARVTRVQQISKIQQIVGEIPKTMQIPKAFEIQKFIVKEEMIPKVIPRVTTRQIPRVTTIVEPIVTTTQITRLIPPIFAPTIPRLPIAPYLPQVPYGAPPIFRAAYRLPKRAPPKVAYKPSLYGVELGARIRKAPRFVAGGVVGIRPMVIVPRARPSRAPVAPPRKRESAFGFLRRTAVFLGGTAKPPIPTANIRMRMPSFTARTPKRRMPDLRRLL